MSTTASQETIDRLKEQAAAEAEGGDDIDPNAGPAEPVSPDPEKVKKDSRREYIVFQQGSGDGTWVEVERAVAGTGDNAILSLGDRLKASVKYAATPSRNWHERTPSVETQTTIKLK